MTYVWIVQSFDKHGTDILGVFDTEEKANNFKNLDHQLIGSFAFICINKRKVE